MADQLLAGLKVVECGNFISAAHCAKMMADLDAEVVKVEEPGKVRSSGPLLGQDNEYIFKGLLKVSDDEYNKLVEEKVIF